MIIGHWREAAYVVVIWVYLIVQPQQAFLDAYMFQKLANG